MYPYLRLFNTVKFLKFTQIYYRIYYFLIKKIYKKNRVFYKASTGHALKLIKSININTLYKEKNKFTFLNLEVTFNSEINWNYSKHGKLWTYNLNYFDYLSQDNKELNLSLIYSFIENSEMIKDGLEPFPISLRAMNWVKYLSYYQIEDQLIDNSLYAQYYILIDNLEYHLLGNHLLENAFSLLFGAYYFKDERLYKDANKILFKELDEQILVDGAHFELSPMYHKIMLFRVLDSINLLEHNSWKSSKLLNYLRIIAGKMLGWLKAISYKNDEIPLFNDSAKGVAPSNKQLYVYAHKLGVKIDEIKLLESGYRKISKEYYECIIDVGVIGASYIPGHAHADALNFEIQFNNKPFIVDTGISTYENNSQRILERSTTAHNTVEVNSCSQSEVWGAFRVGNRANIIELKENENSIKATHNGYKKEKILHTRKWTFKEHSIIIQDHLSKSAPAIARFHFAPNIKEDEILRSIETLNNNFNIKEYLFSSEFNKKISALVLEIHFEEELMVEICNLKLKDFR